MGAGKSTIGKALAKQLRLLFADTDDEIERRTGADIPWIFDVEGEDGFRDREQQVVEEMTQMDRVCLATGGGVVMRPRNCQVLAARGFVIYLYTTLEEQIRRTARDRRRPLLNNEDPAATLAALMEIRDPLYRDIADLVIETGPSSPSSVANAIVRELEG